MLQHTDERRDRAAEHIAKATRARGVARGLKDIALQISELTPGDEPTREAQTIAITTLHRMASEAVAHAITLEHRAAHLHAHFGR